MAKNLKLKIKNSQIAAAVSLGGLKEKLAKKQAPAPEVEESAAAAPASPTSKARSSSKKVETKEAPKPKEPPPKVKARSRSVFADPSQKEEGQGREVEETHAPAPTEAVIEEPATVDSLKHLFRDEPVDMEAAEEPTPAEPAEEPVVQAEAIQEVTQPPVAPAVPTPPPAAPAAPISRIERILREPMISPSTRRAEAAAEQAREMHRQSGRERLGPTGRHVRDLLPPPRPPAPQQQQRPASHADSRPKPAVPLTPEDAERAKLRARAKGRPETAAPAGTDNKGDAKTSSRFKEYKDIKPVRKQEGMRSFDGRDRQGLRESEDEQGWRRRRGQKQRIIQETTIRPTSLKVRVPISIKVLSAEMKLKASQLIEKLFAQGAVYTINDLLDDETTIQVLGQEFGCEITLDTSEEERIRITDKSIKEEVAQSNADNLVTRPPVVAFMGHVDHGKTSLIDAIRKSNRVAGEAGAITQHIGAFQCHTAVGDITVLDTPGLEAFSAMRARGADVTDIVVLVVAGDEGMRTQTVEAIQHAKAAGVTIVVAINKSDKPNFNAENVYRQLSEQELLPEAWGGTTITVNCSAVTGEGIQQLLEMLAIQSEVLELKADPTARARGTVLESEMHKGLGAVATVLVQNGTLRPGDALVFGQHWGRVKTMRNDLAEDLLQAGPSTPVEITGLSGLPGAGQDFIVVRNDTEAREIAEARMMDFRTTRLQKTKRKTMENLFQDAAVGEKKILNAILRADVQGSLEALKVALEKIESDKVILNIIFHGVGEVSESDVTLALASKAVIIGFHTSIESHADALVKQSGVQVRLHDIIYHAIDDVKLIMTGLLDRIAEEHDRGKAEVKATFKSSHLGLIAGCQVVEGTISRNHHMRVMRNGVQLWKGPISSLKRVKEDVREVTKGQECGILLQGFKEIEQGDMLEAFEVTYREQTL